MVSCDNETPSFPSQLPSPSAVDLAGLDVSYLEDESYRDNRDRALFDLWYHPNSFGQTGLVIYIHGGGFTSGDKSFVRSYQDAVEIDFPADIRRLLEGNVAFASINYTLLNGTGETVGIAKSLSDIKYALQFFRENAANYNLNPDRIVVAGNSAGAGSAFWLATVNDLADEDDDDPIERQSTRVQGAVCFNTQATYDIFSWGERIFQEYNLDWESRMQEDDLREAVTRLFGVSELSEIQGEEMENYVRLVDMIERLTEDDPELFVRTNRNKQVPQEIFEFNHHVNHAEAIKQKCDDIGVPIVAYYGKNPPIYEDPTGEDWVEYCLRKIDE
jgi:pimeloyl-ACP methyl ester carboxylesterase